MDIFEISRIIDFSLHSAGAHTNKSLHELASKWPVCKLSYHLLHFTTYCRKQTVGTCRKTYHKSEKKYTIFKCSSLILNNVVHLYKIQNCKWVTEFSCNWLTFHFVSSLCNLQFKRIGHYFFDAIKGETIYRLKQIQFVMPRKGCVSGSKSKLFFS